MLALENKLGYHFKNKKLLTLALTHRSYASEHNERLEFLGDAVLNYAIAEWLFEQYPQANEGHLSRMRAHLVQEKSLAVIAASLAIPLRLSEGEIKSGGLSRPAILADALEALIGAITLDADFSAGRSVIRKLYSAFWPLLQEKIHTKDYKSHLQEILQKQQMPLPQYDIVSLQGPPHRQKFEISCTIPGTAIHALAIGDSRKKAEQAAASLVLTILENPP